MELRRAASEIYVECELRVATDTFDLRAACPLSPFSLASTTTALTLSLPGVRLRPRPPRPHSLGTAAGCYRYALSLSFSSTSASFLVWPMQFRDC